MSRFLNKIGIPPVWGTNLSHIKDLFSGTSFKEKLRILRIKKMKNPELKISEEVEKLLKEEIK